MPGRGNIRLGGQNKAKDAWDRRGKNKVRPCVLVKTSESTNIRTGQDLEVPGIIDDPDDVTRYVPVPDPNDSNFNNQS